jgi:tRNA(His) 5'-end guanylyltransferase
VEDCGSAGAIVKRLYAYRNIKNGKEEYKGRKSMLYSKSSSLFGSSRLFPVSKIKYKEVKRCNSGVVFYSSLERTKYI